MNTLFGTENRKYYLTMKVLCYLALQMVLTLKSHQLISSLTLSV